MRRIIGILSACAITATGAFAIVGAVELVVPSLSALTTWPPDEVGGVAYATAIVLVLGAGLVATARLGLASLRASRRLAPTHDLEQLVSEARTDSLTTIANRRAFQSDLAAEIERRNRSGSV